MRGVEVLLAADSAIQPGGFGGSGGSGGPGRDGGPNFEVLAPSGLDGFDGFDGIPGEPGSDGVTEVILIGGGEAPGIGNGDFSQGLAFFLESGEGTASIVDVAGDPALQMSVDAGTLSLTQLVGTDGASGLQVDLDYAFQTAAGTLEVVLGGNPVLGVTPAGATSPVGVPVVTPGAPFNHVSLICPNPLAPADSALELSLRLLPGSSATVQVDNLALQAPAPAVPGDLDGDGDVDLDDVGSVVNCFGQFVADNPACAIADVAPPPDGDGVVNILDVSFVGSNFTP